MRVSAQSGLGVEFGRGEDDRLLARATEDLNDGLSVTQTLHSRRSSPLEDLLAHTADLLPHHAQHSSPTFAARPIPANPCPTT